VAEEIGSTNFARHVKKIDDGEKWTIPATNQGPPKVLDEIRGALKRKVG
jgi:hypothetical protein